MKKYNKKKIILTTCVITFLIFTLCALISYDNSTVQPRTSIKKAKKHADDPTVSMVAVGDNIIHENVFKFARNGNTYNFKPCYQNVKKYISQHDLAYVNQETLIAGNQYGIKGYPNFNSPEALIEDLKDTGFNMVSGATNHSMDLGKDALISSAQLWKKQSNILFSGLYDSQEDRQTIRVIEKNGIRFSFLSYTFGVNEATKRQYRNQLQTYPYILGQLDKEQIKEDVEKAKEQSDVIIVACHWGKEDISQISDLQKEYAQYFADLGVDVVIGNHPHQIQPIEKINNTLVIYSLGNFLSTMKGVYNQLEGIISLDFVKKANNISIENITYIPLINHYNDDVVTIYPLQDYTQELASQHTILKNQPNIIEEFKTYIQETINNKDIKIKM